MSPSGRSVALLPICLIAVGCHHSGSKPPARLVQTEPPANVVVPAVADLSKPFGYEQTVASAGKRDPLNVGKAFARAAGGTWIVLAAHALDDVKGDASYNPAGNQTVASYLESLNRLVMQVKWELRDGYMLAFFGTPGEFDAFKAKPPIDVDGLYLCSDSLDGLVTPVNDMWHTSIAVDPSLASRRTAISRAMSSQSSDNNPSNIAAALYGYNPSSAASDKAPAFEIKIADRATLADVVKRIADMLGGDAVEVNGGWKVQPEIDAAKLATSIQLLKSRLEENASNPASWGSSYASRASGGVGETGVDLPPLREEEQADIEALAARGTPAVPVLAGFVDARTPALAGATIPILASMPDPAARAALAECARRLAQAPDPKDCPMCGELFSRILRYLEKDPPRGATAIFASAVGNEGLAPKARYAARMALISAGDLKPLLASDSSHAWQPPDVNFDLKEKPAPVSSLASPGASISPIAITRTEGGEEWAVFLSAKYGDPRDIWIARGRIGRWEEFLFTGQPFVRTQDYGYGGADMPAACAIEVKGDTILLRPPDPKLAAEAERLRLAMQDPKLRNEDRSKMYRRFSELSQKLASTIARPLTLSLTDLRKDSDRDGLPDVVEARFGTDPANADTDGDGVQDAQDQNPLGKLVAGDRGRILQTVFSAFFGGDTSTDPILVVLDRPYWQAFTGARARVLCVTREEYARRPKQLGSFRALEFGGPSTREDTILQMDGPCLLNESHDMAEIHFWLWNTAPADIGNQYAGVGAGTGSALPVEYVARFRGNRRWELLSMRTSRFRSADRAVVDYVGRERTGGRRVMY